MSLTDLQFEGALADKQHNEIANLLRDLIAKVSVNNDTFIVDKIIETNKLLNGILAKEYPESHTTVDIEPLVLEIRKNNTLLEKLLEDRAAQKTIEFTRNTLGLINSPILIK